MPFQEPGLETETVEWISRVRAVGSVSTPTALKVDRVFKGLKAQTLMSSFRRLNLCVGSSLSSSLIPQINTQGGATDTNVNLLSTDYDESLGWQTNGSTKYINAGYTFVSELLGGQYVYLRTTQASDGTARNALGHRDSTSPVCGITGNCAVDNTPSAGEVRGKWLGVTTGTSSAAMTTGGLIAGGWGVARTASNSVYLAFNGASVGTATGTISATSNAEPLYIMCDNGNGAAARFLASGSRVAGYAVLTGVSAATMARIHTIIRDFQVSMGRDV